MDNMDDFDVIFPDDWTQDFRPTVYNTRKGRTNMSALTRIEGNAKVEVAPPPTVVTSFDD